MKEKSKKDFGRKNMTFSWFFMRERETRERERERERKREREKRKGVPLLSTIYGDRVVGSRRAKS